MITPGFYLASKKVSQKPGVVYHRSMQNFCRGRAYREVFIYMTRALVMGQNSCTGLGFYSCYTRGPYPSRMARLVYSVFAVLVNRIHSEKLLTAPVVLDQALNAGSRSEFSSTPKSRKQAAPQQIFHISVSQEKQLSKKT